MWWEWLYTGWPVSLSGNETPVAEERSKVEELEGRVHYLELGAHPSFGKFFAEALRFPRPKVKTTMPTHSLNSRVQ